jgi:hypothetical protein
MESKLSAFGYQLSAISWVQRGAPLPFHDR